MAARRIFLKTISRKNQRQLQEIETHYEYEAAQAAWMTIDSFLSLNGKVYFQLLTSEFIVLLHVHKKRMKTTIILRKRRSSSEVQKNT